ncbi:hypothetical protein NQ318_002122 [Aromia moschata]|uniref:ER lumen protein-retaining receptor n=1 Tax=Aromia moschata TaxID=1265417 RepID=A0AAV8Y0U1_9CUCU|nr:hypothetical protein NQ318_002122 [Aromia moschata]
MYIVRIIGDFCHLAALFLLLAKIFNTKSCRGLSGKTQLLFSIIFIARYADLWLEFTFISLYNTIMKLIFMKAALVSTFLIMVVYRKTYEKNNDTYVTELLLVPCFTLALIAGDRRDPVEIMWIFSIFLEAVAIIPQLYMIISTRKIEKIVVLYLVLLALYRTLYVVKWIHRYFAEGYYDHISFVGGTVQVLTYVAAIPVFRCLGVTVTEEGEKTYLRKNIFFISSNEPLDATNLIRDNDVEKSEKVENEIPKV